MLSMVNSYGLTGIDGYKVKVEVDVYLVMIVWDLLVHL